MQMKSFHVIGLVLVVLLGLAFGQQTLEKIPVVDFQRETKLDGEGLKQFKAFDVACEPCKGTGELPCEHCALHELDGCVECGKAGKAQAPCRTCAGTGKQHDPLLLLKCTYCKGAGWYDCALCGGRGIITESSTDGTSLEKPCGGCKKVGRIKCNPCEGKRALEVLRLRKKPLSEASPEDLKEAREVLVAAMTELEPFEPLDRASKTTKALEKIVSRPSKLVPELKDMLELMEEVQKGLARAGANYTNFTERQTFQFLTFRDRSVHLMRHDVRAIDVCLERAEFNAKVGK